MYVKTQACFYKSKKVIENGGKKLKIEKKKLTKLGKKTTKLKIPKNIS